MAKKKNNTDVHSDLREKAEEKLKQHEPHPEHLSPEEVQHLIHELSVHQIELEMQNDELRNTQVELEQAHRDYIELFDYAPVGYIIFNKDGMIAKANLTTAAMFGVDRSEIEGKPFLTFLAKYSSEGFFGHLQEALKTKKQQVVLEIKRPAAPTIWAKLLTVPVLDEQGNLIHFRTAIIDITDVAQFKVYERTK